MTSSISTTFVFIVMMGIGARSCDGLTVWAELPLIVAQGSAENVSCYFKRIQGLVNGANVSTLQGRVDKLIVRIEDPWAGLDSTTDTNSWIFDPDRSTWMQETNPFFEMLVNISAASTNVSVYFLPQLHNGDFFKWPCYSRSYYKQQNCSRVPDFLSQAEVIECVGSGACEADTDRPAGCSCTKSWECASLWCGEEGKCSFSFERSNLSPENNSIIEEKTCRIPYAVSGDAHPFANCCGKLTLDTTVLDFTGSACCESVESTSICNEDEVRAKGGAFPCINPLNRLSYWMWKWSTVLESDWDVIGGFVFDMESTGLPTSTLIEGMRYYLGSYFGSSADGIRMGATTGLVVPAPGSGLDAFDFWLTEAYNLYTASVTKKDPITCDSFLVDSLPFTASKYCGRECKGLLCDSVNPPCTISNYIEFQDDPYGLAGVRGGRERGNVSVPTFRRLLVPDEIERATDLCTTSWVYSLGKHYSIPYYRSRHNGASVADSKLAGQESVKAALAKTTVLFSSESVPNVSQVATACLYPSDGGCGIPRAFGTWSLESFLAFVEEAFPLLAFNLTLDDGESDEISLRALKENREYDYAGIFQLSFIPPSWLGSGVVGAC